MSNEIISNLDPLSIDHMDEDLKEQIQKTNVKNIVSSYIGKWSIFSELIQNSLDAIDRRTVLEENNKYEGKLFIKINLQENSLTVSDNGCGLTLDELKTFLTPSKTMNKKRGVTRGNKGVGATYLSYGFNNFVAHTKNKSQEYGIEFMGARDWLETNNPKKDSIPKPVIKDSNYIANELVDHDSGTSIKIKLGGNQSESPRDLSWLKVTEPEIWHKLLRAKTPLGNLDPVNKKTKVSVSIQVKDKNGNNDGRVFSNTENNFYYPHFFFNNIQYIRDILNEREKQSPWSIDNTKHSFKNLDAVMESWTHNEILDSGDFSTISKDEEKRKLIEKYQVSIDLTVLHSATAWKKINEDDLKITRTNEIGAGLQLATDSMITGSVIPIKLNRNTQYSEQSYILVHFKDGQPDMGRKSFPEEMQQLAIELAARSIYYFYNNKIHLNLAKVGALPSTGKDAFIQKSFAKDYLKDNPFDHNDISIIASPRTEQDVIGLFHQCCGSGILKGIKTILLSERDRYDSIVKLDYLKNHAYVKNNILGISEDYINEEIKKEFLVLEYKYNCEHLEKEFNNHDKEARDIDLIVCWELHEKIKNDYNLESFFLDESHSSRKFFGSSFIARHQVQDVSFEIICLKDIFLFKDSKIDEIKNIHNELAY